LDVFNLLTTASKVLKSLFDMVFYVSAIVVAVDKTYMTAFFLQYKGLKVSKECWL